MKNTAWLRKTAASLALVSAAVAAPPVVRVTVIDSVHVEERTLALAMAQAQRVFKTAGLEIEWNSCRIGQRPSDCELSPWVVRIIGRPLDGFARRTMLGFSVFAEEGSVYATVFRDRVSDLATGAHVSEAVLLGTAIAHELGHLLLGNMGHARQGVMAWPWTRPQLDRAAAGLLGFQPAEVAVMREEVRRRSVGAPALRTSR